MPIECPTPCAQQNSLTKVLFNYVLLFESRWVRTSRLVWILSISSSSLIPSSERKPRREGNLFTRQTLVEPGTRIERTHLVDGPFVHSANTRRYAARS
jgi:hypothetical protein